MASEAGLWSTHAMPTHPDGSVDGRYTLATEWAGQAQPSWVARFCGEWINGGADEFAVWLKIVAHNRDRREALGID